MYNTFSLIMFQKLAKSRRSETVHQSLLVAIQTKNKDLRDENLSLKERVCVGCEKMVQYGHG